MSTALLWLFYPFTFNGYELELGYGSQEVVRPDRLTQLSLGDTGARAFSPSRVPVSGRTRKLSLGEKKLYSYPGNLIKLIFVAVWERGVSDDLALLYIGRCYGFDAMLGGFFK